MFDGLKKLFSTEPEHASLPPPVGSMTRDDRRQVADWALAAGYGYTEPPLSKPSLHLAHSPSPEQGFSLEGKVLDKAWRVECRPSSRDFIHTRELRGRCDVDIPDSVAVVLMNRALHTLLEKQAYALYTDSVQTVVDPQLGEEMRWLAAYASTSWHDAPNRFFDRYAVLAAKHAHAQAWLSASVAKDILNAPPAAAAQVPFMLMLLRGRCYLRMQYSPADVATLQYGVGIFVTACASALSQKFDDSGGADDVEGEEEWKEDKQQAK
jgi:hypothetical protein